MSKRRGREENVMKITNNFMVVEGAKGRGIKREEKLMRREKIITKAKTRKRDNCGSGWIQIVKPRRVRYTSGYRSELNSEVRRRKDQR
jgi:hypothetical protein